MLTQNQYGQYHKTIGFISVLFRSQRRPHSLDNTSFITKSWLIFVHITCIMLYIYIYCIEFYFSFVLSVLYEFHWYHLKALIYECFQNSSNYFLIYCWQRALLVHETCVMHSSRPIFDHESLKFATYVKLSSYLEASTEIISRWVLRNPLLFWRK